MKIRDLDETMRTGDMSSSMEKVFNNIIENHYKTMNHIGDMEKYKIFHKKINNNDVFVIVDENPIGFVSTSKNKNIKSLDNMFIIEAYRGNKILSMFLLFLKRVMKFNKIMIGSFHNDTVVNIIKNIHHRFNTYWIDDNGNTFQYDPENIDSFYSYQEPTEWNLILENNSNFQWPRYYDESIENFSISMLYENCTDGQN